MTALQKIIAAVREAADYNEKSQLVDFMVRGMGKSQKRLDAADAQALADLAMAEIRALPASIEAAEGSRAKDEICSYANLLPNLLMMVYASPDAMTESDRESLRALGVTLKREQFLESAVREAFERGMPTVADIDRLLCIVSPLKDEYRKMKFYSGLLHYRAKVERLSDDAKAVLARYTAAELSRYLAMDSFDADVRDALEVLCDVCILYMTDDIADRVAAVMERGDTAIRYYAMATLIRSERAVPDAIIAALAADMEYANLTYITLRDAGQASRFPAAYGSPEYLAQSDMIHWLLYPTELGQMPDEIECLGKVKKKDVYYVFRFKSRSDTLSEDCKGVWLIGWSSEEGGTFSNFDRYDDYVKKTPEKTLKYIRRKLL